MKDKLLTINKFKPAWIICFLLMCFLPSISFSQIGEFIWQENFNELDEDRWTIVTGNGCEHGNDMCGWGNQELQYYSRDNVYIEEIAEEPGNYALVIEARRENKEGSSFTSGKIESKQKVAVKYGMIEVRLKVPDLETGLWPAAWLLGETHETDGWPYCGEIDMMEMGHKHSFRAENDYASSTVNEFVGSNLIWFSEKAIAPGNPLGGAGIATDKYYNQPYAPIGNPLNDRFVKYRLYWDDSNIRFTVVDEDIEHDLFAGPFPISSEAITFNKPFYLLLNMAVGGNFTDALSAGQVTADIPAKMYVDYVHVRKWNGKGEILDQSKLHAVAGNDQILSSGETVKLNAGASYGPISSYKWFIDGQEVATGETAEINLDDGQYRITLFIYDNDGLSSSDDIYVKIGTPADDVGEVIWEENFDTFDSSIWGYDIGDGCEFGPDMCGWGNFELQYYSEDNVSIEPIPGEPGNNALVIEARKESKGSSSFTSGKVSTEGKLAIKYGVIEVRMMVPDLETGLWPAAWLLGANHKSAGWPLCGEMDIMEMGHAKKDRERYGKGYASPNNFVGANLIWQDKAACSGQNATCAAGMAWDPYFNQPYVSGSPLSNRFVKYRMYWNEDMVIYSIIDNGVETELYADVIPLGGTPELASTFQKPFYFLLNMAVGGNFTDATEESQVTANIPAKMYVDYVKVMKWKGKGEVIYEDSGLYVDAGATIEVIDTDRDGKEEVTLNGSASYGNIEEYKWVLNGVEIAHGVNPTVELPVGSHSVNLIISDDKGNTKSDAVEVHVREIIWEDQFDSLDESLWNFVVGDGCEFGPDMCGWGNHELQYYDPSNLSIEQMPNEPGNNALVIEARRESKGNSSFTSGKIDTENKVSIKYGIIEVRMQVPDLKVGLWPAAWLLGLNHSEVDWPYCGEIDMMEMGHHKAARDIQEEFDADENSYVGANLIWYSEDAIAPGNLTGAASIAYDKHYNNPYAPIHNPMNDRPITYRLYWDPSEIRFTVIDGVEVDLYKSPKPLDRESDAFHKPFFFILNMAVGGDFTDAITSSQVTADLPAKMFVDYVRVMKWNGHGAVTLGEDRLVADAGNNKVVNIGSPIYLDGSASASMNGKITKYEWSIGNSLIATGVTPQVELGAGIHTITLKVTDDQGATDTDEVIITVGNMAFLVANAGKDRTVDDGETVILDGSGSSDPDDNIVSYKWYLNGKQVANTVKPDVTSLIKMGKNVFTLIVKNGDGEEAQDKVTITKIDMGIPVANAGSNQSHSALDSDLPMIITLDGSNSSDPDGSIVKYQWYSYEGEIANTAIAQVSLNAGTHAFTLVVTDNDGKTDSDDVTITISKRVGGGDLVLSPTCVDDFTVEVTSDKNNPSITFVPNTPDVGNGTLIFFYDTDKNKFPSVPANNITANTPFTVTASERQEVFMSFTYSTGQGEKNNVACLMSFIVGSSSETIVNPPTAKAGNNQTIFILPDETEATVELNGSSSSGNGEQIVSYEWYIDGQQVASGATATVNLTEGVYTVFLKVTNSSGVSSTDQVTIEVIKEVATAITNKTERAISYARDNNIMFNYSNEGLATFRIFNISGEIIYNNSLLINKGDNVVTNITDKGLYVIWVNIDGNNYIDKVIIN